MILFMWIVNPQHWDLYENDPKTSIIFFWDIMAPECLKSTNTPRQFGTFLLCNPMAAGAPHPYAVHYKMIQLEKYRSSEKNLNVPLGVKLFWCLIYFFNIKVLIIFPNVRVNITSYISGGTYLVCWIIPYWMIAEGQW